MDEFKEYLKRELGISDEQYAEMVQQARDKLKGPSPTAEERIEAMESAIIALMGV